MTEHNHTAGPWFALRYCDKTTDDFVVGTKKGSIAKLTLFSEEQKMQAEANAHLIAAAPELLAALDLVWDKVLTEYYSPDSYVRQQVEAAIAKARGE